MQQNQRLEHSWYTCGAALVSVCINCLSHQSLSVAILWIQRQSCVTLKSGLIAVCQCWRTSPRSSQVVLLYCVSYIQQHRSFSQPGVVHWTGSVFGHNTTRSLQCCSCWIACIPAWSASVRHQCSSSHELRCDHVTSLLKELQWPWMPERIEFKLCALVYKCPNGSGPTYLANSLQRVTDVQSRRRLWSSSSSTLVLPVTRRGWPFIFSRGHPSMERSIGLRHGSAISSHRSVSRWTCTFSHGLSDTDNTRYTDFVTCSWSAMRLHHANYCVVWWWWWSWWWCRRILRSWRKARNLTEAAGVTRGLLVVIKTKQNRTSVTIVNWFHQNSRSLGRNS